MPIHGTAKLCVSVNTTAPECSEKYTSKYDGTAYDKLVGRVHAEVTASDSVRCDSVSPDARNASFSQSLVFCIPFRPCLVSPGLTVSKQIGVLHSLLILLETADGKHV